MCYQNVKDPMAEKAFRGLETGPFRRLRAASLGR